ncbi:SpoIIE family protein phosphatase [Streptomyces scopuliridis]|uniref:SpoIIE family protein phosphatase n=1 Tax=Streptomyces scopuliridis TaxID=452529 RepID=A0ACD4ZJM3_9ACTN|nr:SpoIIE family protein phosphatase [Streptomyces scopuliridis]WSB98502.1 SpoIIE family protein phosphatase [Streptomyces scopuliridis]WSC07796.1 SpoIIE family protein phosphatase [Streptomyces scopuliridis]
MARHMGRSWARALSERSGRRPRSRRRDHPRTAGEWRRWFRRRAPRLPQGWRRPSWLNVRTLAGQVFILQLVIVLLLIGSSLVSLLLVSRRDTEQEARNRCLSVATAFANSPGIAPALRAPDPTAILQPRAEAVRKASDVDFVVVLNTKGIRLTHPNPERIGEHFIGHIGPSLKGHTITEIVPGTLGPSVRAVTPVKDAHGKVVGLVSAGITIAKVQSLANREVPIVLGAAAASLALATGGTALVSGRLRRQTHGLEPVEMARMYEHHDAVLHVVREGVLIVDGDGRLVLANDEAVRLLDLPPRPEGLNVTDLGLDPQMTDLLSSGRVATDEVLATGERLLAVNNRSTDRDGGPPGTVATLRDSTELRALTGRAEAARKRLKLLYDAGVEIGTTLDVTRTAEELARVSVPRFADFVAVDLAEAILRGEDPAGVTAASELRRTAVVGIHDDHPFYPLGARFTFRPSTPQARSLRSGRGTVEPALGQAEGWRSQDPEHTARVVAYGVHSLITTPLRARGVLLGLVSFWRAERPEPFEEEDVSLAEELANHAAVCIDNARRYTREHTMAETLQRSLLPRRLPEQTALDVAYRYLPAESGVGGDWFDVIPLPGARVALVVGDVVGHGLLAAATMGRLRTAVHNFSSLDLPPDEILSHLDDLVTRIDHDEGIAGGGAVVTGATCLYAIYDPVTRVCSMARAGHPPPALVGTDGSVEFLDLPAGTPLGLGGLPFETVELRLPEASHLVLYTDGLIEDRDREIDDGLHMLRAALAHPHRDPEETCTAVLEALLPDRPSDDIALIVARTRVLQPDRIAEWEVPSHPSEVSRVRAAVARQLADWGLDELAYPTELILSELITNAIRYALGPIKVRLLRDRSLICEVSDFSSTSPHLRYAAATDEGGRGLFLVAQFTERWGTRYTAEGKVIWTEQSLPSGAGPVTES